MAVNRSRTRSKEVNELLIQCLLLISCSPSRSHQMIVGFVVLGPRRIYFCKEVSLCLRVTNSSSTRMSMSVSR